MFTPTGCRVRGTPQQRLRACMGNIGYVSVNLDYDFG